MNTLRNKSWTRTATFYAVVFFFMFGLSNYRLLVLCIGDDGHSALELKTQTGYCKSDSYSNFKDNHTSSDLKSVARAHPEPDCGICLDIPILNNGLLPSSHSDSTVQLILSASIMAKTNLITKYFDEKISCPAFEKFFPADPSRSHIPTTILLV